MAYSLRTLSLLWQEGRVAGVSVATGIQRDFLTSQCMREIPLVQGLNYNPYDPPSGEPPLPARPLIRKTSQGSNTRLGLNVKTHGFVGRQTLHPNYNAWKISFCKGTFSERAINQ